MKEQGIQRKRVPYLKPFVLSIFIFICIILPLSAAGPVQASVKKGSGDGGNGYDLVDAVNSYRAQNGLYSLNADSQVMAAAQAHADWIVATGQGGHTGAGGSDETIRVMWSGYGNGGKIHCDEAWAETGSIESAVYDAWSDWTHQGVMLDYWGNGYTDAGGGVADDGNGSFVYVFDICVVVGKASSKAPTMVNTPADGSSEQFAPAATVDTSQFIMSVKVSTPAADGSITHIVDYGQTLVQIALAYGVKVNDIRSLNYMTEDNVLIYPDQKLLILPAGSKAKAVTGAPSTTVTGVVGTPKLADTFTPRPPRSTSTPFPSLMIQSATPQPTQPPVVASGSSYQAIGIALITICGFGLLAFLVFGMKKG
jgi:LysM repeat protein